MTYPGGTSQGGWLPDVDASAVRGLKFGDSLPPDLAVRTLAERLADVEGAAAVMGEGLTVIG